MGPSSFSASQRFQEFRNIEKKMPETVGPGTYEVAKADDQLAHRRKRDLCLSIIEP